MKIGIDIDGTISSNIQFWAQFTEFHKKHLLSMPEADFNHEIHIITNRQKPLTELTRVQLQEWGIKYDVLAVLDKSFAHTKGTVQAEAKARYCKKHGIDVFYDNEAFMYYDVFKKISPETHLVLI